MQAKDANGNNLTSGGSTVVITRSSGTGTIGSVTDNGNGTYTATVTSQTATGSGVFVSTLDGAQVKSGAGSQTQSTISYTAGSLDHFDIPAISTPQTAGTAITGITLTAQDDNNNTVSGFTGTVTYSGTAGITGTSSTFSSGQLTGITVTPTKIGTGLTFIVTGSTKTGTSNSFTVNPIAPTGSSSQSFCSGASPTVANLTATGTSIKWYDASTAGNLMGSSAALTTATHYYASQTENSCESTLRLDVTVTINTSPNLTGLTTTASDVCQTNLSVVTLGTTSLPNGTYTVNYTLTGTNTQGATNESMTVSGGSNGGTFNTPTLSTAGATTVTINSLSLNSCSTTATSGNTHAITITAIGTWLGATSTSWNEPSNWCGGVPGTSTNVVIPSPPTNQPHVDITGGVSHDLTINSGAALTIDAANALTVSGTLTNSAGNSGLLIKSSSSGTASLIHYTDSIPATFERYITGHDSAWHFLSSPVASQVISGNWLPSGTYGGTGGTGYDLYLWDEPKSCWKYILNTKWDSLNTRGNYFNVARGYLYSVQTSNPTKMFAGKLNNGSVSYPLKYASTDATLKGFNLVGNPYPSSIDWQASGWTRTALVTSGSGNDMWIFNPSSQNYGVCNSASGSSGTNGVTRYIAPMQGFFVRAAGVGTLGMTNAVRTHSDANAWKGAQLNPDVLSVVVQSERDQTADEVRILFRYPANEKGAAKLFSPVTTAPSLYLTAAGAKYTVRYLTDTVAYPQVPVHFKPGADGTYSLSVNFEPGAFKIVLLEDLQKKVVQDLTTQSSYRFSSLKTDAANRFVLHFALVKGQASNELPARIYSTGTQIFVDLTRVTGDTHVSVYDVLGRKLYEEQLQGEAQYPLNYNPAGRALLLIQLQNPQGQMVRKILCNNTY